MDNNNNINNAQPVQAQPTQQQYQQPQPAPYAQQQYQSQAQPVQYAQQPVYQQYPGQQYAGQQYQPQQYAGQPVISTQTQDEVNAAANRKKGNILCFISLGLQLIPYVTSGIIGALTDSFNDLMNNSDISSITSGLVSMLMGGSYIASWVFMIIARVKYKNTFSKVLMWIYIGMLAASVIAVIVLIAMCYYMCKDCNF